MRKTVVLTVSESKRLIGKGVANMECVRSALKDGMVVIGTGSTNGYVLEEILGRRIDKTSYRSGLTFPTKGTARSRLSPTIPDVILRAGTQVEGMTRFEASNHMKEGDVFIKGANALDYKSKMAGILIGGGSSGTIGSAIGNIVGKRIELILPVGLEKSVYGDIVEISRALSGEGTRGPTLMPVFGTIVTEIEALEILTGVRAMQVAAGGVGGAEGSISLLLEGTAEQIERTEELLDGIYGEPPWVPWET